MSPKSTHRRLSRAVAAVMVLLTAACGTSAAESPSESAVEAATTLRLGFFPNLTHAPALVGMQEGLFKSELKALDVTLTPTAFNAGPDAVTALFGGSLDIAYIGPNPTINAYIESGGEAIKVIAGAASGGAALVVRPEIKSVTDLKGRSIATPQLGNTQDVAFRYWLQEQGLSATTEGGGDVSIKPQANGEGLAAYAAGDVDGAWVPEPWVAEYVAAGAVVLVDESDLWPGGSFVTTNIVVRTEFLEQNPAIVEAFLKGHLAALDLIAADPAAAQSAVNATLSTLTGSSLDPEVLASAWAEIEFTADPLATTLVASADHAVAVGLLDGAGIDEVGGFKSLYALDLLNELLAAAGKPEVGSL